MTSTLSFTAGPTIRLTLNYLPVANRERRMQHQSDDRTTEKIVNTRLKVLSWNIWWRFGADWQRRQSLILETLDRTDADIIALQEVWGDRKHNQAQEFAKKLTMQWTYDAVNEMDGLDFGNAILSRWPITRQASRLLPSVPSEDGSRDCKLLFVEIDGPRGSLGVFSTHLSWRNEEGHMRQEQVNAILAYVREIEIDNFPPIVCGDFNAIPSSDEIRMITGERTANVKGLVLHDAWTAAGNLGPGFTWDNHNPNTFEALQPNRRLDYVFVGRPKSNGAGHVLTATIIGDQHSNGLYPSDHYGVLCELRY